MPHVPAASESALPCIEAWLSGLLPADNCDEAPIVCSAKPDREALFRRDIVMSSQPRSPRKRARSQLYPSDTRREATGFGSQRPEDEEDEVEQETPKSSRQIAHHSRPRQGFTAFGAPSLTSRDGSPQPRKGREALGSEPPSLSPTRSESSSVLSRTTTTSKASSQRSPVKSTSDLHLAAKPFKYNDEAVLPPILEALKDVRDNISIIPAVIQDDINQALGSNQTVRPWMIDQHDRTERDEALRDLAEIRLIVRESRYCLRMGASEAAWNDGVTSRVLFLALGRVEGVRHHNITTARPQQCLVPKDLSGDHFDGKLVDYSINLITQNGDDEDEMGQGDAEMENAIGNLLSHVPTKRKTINQTCYGPVRFDPCGVSIETKATESSDGRVQLSVWIAAWMEQMRYLRAVASNPSHRRWEELEDFRQPIQLQMPSIIAAGSIWTLYLATDTASKIVFSRLFIVGETNSVLGIYALVKSLQILASWMGGPFRRFIREEILRLPA
ncbi:hypothetical protein CDV31_017002 [Fusarium ambrosium]|uniref:PD-(D/E)XK nuclease-like domain-containing protein n=1 Tax=Fusarium ambrosium TaxID=131363 RepID=A0A428RW72_9HYPO|nr:hypothetical protein CDV31_017002 [Fusarium ambrosium]